METDFNIYDGSLYQRPAPNFSYNEIPANCCAIVHQYQQMYVYNELKINGEIKVRGEIVLK
jgi:hypothetical protein